MAQRTGALVFDELTDRYDIRFDLADYYGGLALRRLSGSIRKGQMEADPYGVRTELVSGRGTRRGLERA